MEKKEDFALTFHKEMYEDTYPKVDVFEPIEGSDFFISYPHYNNKYVPNFGFSVDSLYISFYYDDSLNGYVILKLDRDLVDQEPASLNEGTSG